MSKKAISKDTTKPANNYLNVKITDEYCVAMCTLIKAKWKRTNQEIITEALKFYFNSFYSVSVKR